MRIERYQSSRRQGLSGCGCGLILIGGVIVTSLLFVLIAPALPAIGLRLAGFQPIDNQIAPSAPEPIPQLSNAENVPLAILSAGPFGQQTLTQSSAYTMKINGTETNIAQIQTTENGIATLCAQYTDACSESSNMFRNATVNLHNNGATISGEAFINSLNTWQSISVILSLSPSNQISIDGVEVGGTLFGIPEGQLGQRIIDIQSTANQAIRELTLQANGESYRLSDIILTDTQLVATFR